MTIYQTAPAWTSDPSQLSRKQVGYYRARLRNRVHQLVLRQYLKLEADGLARAEIARRIYKRPEQITRLLGAPGNWTLDTVSDLLLAMGCEPAIAVSTLKETIRSSDSIKEELPNDFSPPPIAGMPAANDEPPKQNFSPFSTTSVPGSSAQPSRSANV